MGKHDRSKLEKAERNNLYAVRYRQHRCERCGHRSSRGGHCRNLNGEAACGGRMK